MPVTDLDTLIAQLKSPDADITHNIDARVLAAGLEDLRNRMSHAEYSQLKALSQARINADRLTAVEAGTAALTNDNVEFRRSVNDATKLPHEHAEKLTELEGRVRACEGAVGATPYKVPKPIEPVSVEPAKVEASNTAVLLENALPAPKPAVPPPGSPAAQKPPTPM
jgi:hypothetical protein